MRRAARGFTLLELLVALFIAAVMFAMGYGAIAQALTSRDDLKKQQARLLELETAVRVLEQDFVQLAPRPVRQAVGDEPSQPALQAGAPGTQPIVAFTRGGWANPNGLERSQLERIAYFLENGTLRRESWFVLDPTLSSTTAKRDLLTHVKSVTIEYLNLQHVWQVQWPPLTVAGAQALEGSLRIRPIAVRITLDTEDFGTIVRVIEVAA
ncbi:MAG TPA: type II secretion system minor pseudopilin GspJ [Steroidobacteraceae bacterium]|nr:type II secretion system minor pseudopilin GspJ [Steroidobacteraceae bacterium]